MKQYNGEKAIISLTSWKGRIKSVSKTIFSLLQNCPGFHIVIVLSEDEFPRKENELPDDLMTIINSDLIELIWVKQNYKCFKKILFTMQKYPDVPIITADDGLIYIQNYAEKLYKNWLEDKTSIIVKEKWSNYGFSWGVGGQGIIFPPGCFNKFTKFTDFILRTNHDDGLYGALAKKFNIKVKQAHVIKKQERVYYELIEGIRTGMGTHYPKMYNDKDIPKIYEEIK